MANNRIFVYGGHSRTSEYSTSFRSIAGAEVDIVATRDNFRALFPSPRFIVSDIAKWASTGYSVVKGYAFILRDTDTSQEWAFCYRGSTETTFSVWYAYAGSGANLGMRVKTISGTSVSDPWNEVDARPFVIFNPDSTTSFAMGFDGPNMTYLAGDFQPPATNPSTNTATFQAWLPGGLDAPRLPGVWHGQWGGAGGRWAFMYDTDIGFARTTYTNGYNSTEHLSIFSGKLFRSYDNGGLASSTDPYDYGIVALQARGQSDSILGSSLTSYPLRSFFVRESGVVETVGFSTTLSPALNRSTAVSGTSIRVRPVEIQVSGHIKGFIDDRIINESFSRDDQAFYLKRLQYPDADNPMIHDHYMYTSAWYKDLPTLGMLPPPGLITE